MYQSVWLCTSGNHLYTCYFLAIAEKGGRHFSLHGVGNRLIQAIIHSAIIQGRGSRSWPKGQFWHPSAPSPGWIVLTVLLGNLEHLPGNLVAQPSGTAEPGNNWQLLGIVEGALPRFPSGTVSAGGSGKTFTHCSDLKFGDCWYRRRGTVRTHEKCCRFPETSWLFSF